MTPSMPSRQFCNIFETAKGSHDSCLQDHACWVMLIHTSMLQLCLPRSHMQIQDAFIAAKQAVGTSCAQQACAFDWPCCTQVAALCKCTHGHAVAFYCYPK